MGGITLAKGTEHPTSAEPVARSVAISSVVVAHEGCGLVLPAAARDLPRAGKSSWPD